METGLFDIQADHLSGIKQARQVDPTSREVVYALFGRTDSGQSISPVLVLQRLDSQIALVAQLVLEICRSLSATSELSFWEGNRPTESIL
jgi:hypothetical protein